MSEFEKQRIKSGLPPAQGLYDPANERLLS